MHHELYVKPIRRTSQSYLKLPNMHPSAYLTGTSNSAYLQINSSFSYLLKLALPAIFLVFICISHIHTQKSRNLRIILITSSQPTSNWSLSPINSTLLAYLYCQCHNYISEPLISHCDGKNSLIYWQLLYICMMVLCRPLCDDVFIGERSLAF